MILSLIIHFQTVSSESRESDKGSVNSDRGSTSSIITSLSNDLTDLAHNASSTLSEFFGKLLGTNAPVLAMISLT